MPRFIPHNLLLFVVAGVLSLGGCSYRRDLTDTERVSTYSVTHSKSRKQAYDDVEIEIAKLYNSSKTVVQVKQPDNGRIIIKAMTHDIEVPNDGGGVTAGSLPYTLDAQVNDTTATFNFEITGPIESSAQNPYNLKFGYPTDVTEVRGEFERTATKLAASFGGVISDRPTPIIHEAASAAPTPTKGGKSQWSK
jgi:hypothetical protein